MDLAVLGRSRGADPFLRDLAHRAELGLGFGVGLLVNGMIVMGQLAKAESMAANIDAEWVTVMRRSEKADDMTDEEWAEIGERVTTQAARVVVVQREEHEQFAEAAESYRVEGILDLTAIPANLARRAIFDDAKCHLTICDARIAAPGQSGATVVDVLRVAVDQITGWWILRTDDEGSSATQLWGLGGDVAQPPPRS